VTTDDRHRAVDAARARLPELIRATVAAVQDGVPVYRGLEQAQQREVEAIASWVLRRLLDAWTSGSPLDDEDSRRFRAIGGARGEDGRPVEAVLRAYRVAAVTGTDLVLDAADDLDVPLDTADVRALSRTVLTAIDELSEAILGGYTAARERIGGDRERALRDLFDDLLAGRHTSPSALADRCRDLDLELPPAPLLLVVDADVPALTTELDAVLATSRDHRTMLLLASGTEVAASVATALRERGLHGCLLSGREPVTFRLAVDALDTAPGHAFHGRPVLDDGDAQLLALLAARPDADPAAVVAGVLGPLADPAQRHLLDGLGAFLSTGSATGAAQALHLHPQTLRYRLRRCHALTGRDPRDPWHRLVLDVARTLATFRSGKAGVI
jgi:hypothetical protein